MTNTTKIVKRRIRLRQDTKANFESYNKIPALGEPCYETDTQLLKIGDGVSTYTALPYMTVDTAKNYTTGGTIESGFTTTKGLIGVKTYSLTTTYSLNDIVETVNSSDETKLYRSLVNSNVGNPLTDTTKWGEVLLGSAIDGLSITENSDKEIQAIGVINQNSSGNVLKIHSCSQAEYDAMATHDSNTLYITPDAYGPAFLPIGTILPFAGATVPDGFLLCDGSALSRTTYSALFSAIGTAYGAGDGNTTFNIPNFTSAYLGVNGQGYLSAGLPNITGEISIIDRAFGPSGTGAFYTDTTTTKWSNWSATSTTAASNYKLDASRSTSIYGSSSTVQPYTCKTNMIIKY